MLAFIRLAKHRILILRARFRSFARDHADHKSTTGTPDRKSHRFTSVKYAMTDQIEMFVIERVFDIFRRVPAKKSLTHTMTVPSASRRPALD